MYVSFGLRSEISSVKKIKNLTRPLLLNIFAKNINVYIEIRDKHSQNIMQMFVRQP